MKNILILYPHFPPSNLAGVHRPRLFARHLPAFGWKPTILTVDEKYYEEEHDWNLVKLLPAELPIEKASAFKITSPRFIGDIGLRAFFQLYKKAKKLIKKDQIDFLYIPIPSFYCALLGRLLHYRMGIPYGIDYIDPWVHDFPGSGRIFSRPWFSKMIAKILEPVAVKKACLITGVAESYYADVIKRNPHLKDTAICGSMPYGGEPADHEMLKQLGIDSYLFKKSNKLQMVYAGALLPKAYHLLDAVFSCIASYRNEFEDVEFHFIGTGTANVFGGYNIKPLAVKYGIWESVVYEYPKRIPYLDVLIHLQNAGGIFILGSTEPHYTPSKIYQGVLSGKPLFAILHRESTAVKIIRGSGAGIVLDFDSGSGNPITKDFIQSFRNYRDLLIGFSPSQVNTREFETYSAESVTRQLAVLLDLAIAGK